MSAGEVPTGLESVAQLRQGVVQLRQLQPLPQELRAPDRPLPQRLPHPLQHRLLLPLQLLLPLPLLPLLLPLLVLLLLLLLPTSWGCFSVHGLQALWLGWLLELGHECGCQGRD